MLDLVIVGAGATGIAAARACKRRGLSCRVYEAKPHPGGRAWTVRFRGRPLDLGAQWLHTPAHNPLLGLAATLGVACGRRPPGVRYALRGRLLDAAGAAAAAAAIEDCFEAMRAAARTGNDCAAAAFAPASGPWRDAFAAAFAIRHGVAAAEASAIDTAAYAAEGEDVPVAGGVGALLRRAAHGLPICCSAPVAEIDLRAAGHVTVSGHWGTARARHAVVTVSTGVLASGALRFRPALPGRIAAAVGSLPMGSCNKVAVGFSRPVFGGLAGRVLVPYGRPDEPVEIVLARSRATGLVHGRFGRELAAAGAAAMRAWLIDALADICGNALRPAAAEGTAATDWDGDPHVRGYVAAARPGAAGARAALAGPVQGRLHFAGEAVATPWMGDLHGAWLAGERAVARIAGAA